MELFRRQLRAFTWLIVRVVACGLLLTLLKPLWRSHPWLENIAFGTGALLCGVPLLRAVARNWAWRIALGRAYLTAGQYSAAEQVLSPVNSSVGRFFDPKGLGGSAWSILQEKRRQNGNDAL